MKLVDQAKPWFGAVRKLLVGKSIAEQIAGLQALSAEREAELARIDTEIAGTSVAALRTGEAPATEALERERASVADELVTLRRGLAALEGERAAEIAAERRAAEAERRRQAAADAARIAELRRNRLSGARDIEDRAAALRQAIDRYDADCAELRLAVGANRRLKNYDDSAVVRFQAMLARHFWRSQVHSGRAQDNLLGIVPPYPDGDRRSRMTLVEQDEDLMNDLGIAEPPSEPEAA